MLTTSTAVSSSLLFVDVDQTTLQQTPLGLYGWSICGCWKRFVEPDDCLFVVVAVSNNTQKGKCHFFQNSHNQNNWHYHHHRQQQFPFQEQLTLIQVTRPLALLLWTCTCQACSVPHRCFEAAVDKPQGHPKTCAFLA